MSSNIELGDDLDLQADDVEGAVLVGLWASGARCVLQYLVAPGLGAFGLWLPWAGLLLQCLGCVVTVAGAAQVYCTRRHGWPLWLGVAGLVVLSTSWGVVGAV